MVRYTLSLFDTPSILLRSEVFLARQSVGPFVAGKFLTQSQDHLCANSMGDSQQLPVEGPPRRRFQVRSRTS